MKNLSVVLKTVERCNINCTYCYMFNMEDQTYKNRPAYISLDTIYSVCKFLKQGCLDLKLEELTIGFHGGEPLMQKKNDFIEMCDIFNGELKSLVKLDFTLQTNAMLIDKEWIEIFYKYKIGVGVSIDGPKEYHDVDRIDKKGNGTYERVIKGVDVLKNSLLMQEMGNFGLICVINPEHNAKKIYRHFVDDIGAKCIDFLLPHYTHDYTLPHTPEAYGLFLCELFDEWTSDDNPKIQVRLFLSVLNSFLGGYSYVYGFGPMPIEELPLLSICTNGEITPTDEFRVMGSIIYNGSTVINTTLADYLKQPLFEKLKSAQINLPKSCIPCCWNKICGGGSLNNRFSQSNGFNNASIYCDGLKKFYSTVNDYFERKMM